MRLMRHLCSKGSPDYCIIPGKAFHRNLHYFFLQLKLSKEIITLREFNEKY